MIVDVTYALVTGTAVMGLFHAVQKHVLFKDALIHAVLLGG